MRAGAIIQWRIPKKLSPDFVHAWTAITVRARLYGLMQARLYKYGCGNSTCFFAVTKWLSEAKRQRWRNLMRGQRQRWSKYQIAAGELDTQLLES